MIMNDGAESFSFFSCWVELKKPNIAFQLP